MPVTKIKLENFTAFKDLEVEFSPGINALIGANGTGKTHLMKACYAACETSKNYNELPTKLIRLFLPSGGFFNGLVHQAHREDSGQILVYFGEQYLSCSMESMGLAIYGASSDVATLTLDAAYVPAKDMLANAPGFRSLYERREIHFEEVYYDILSRAYLPPLREPVDAAHERMLDNLQIVIGGKVTLKGEEFFLSNDRGDLEFTLLAEGWRKLGLLWLLIRNGTLRDGSVLFWDEPEANLNPKMFRVVVEVLLELQRAGVQVFFATHDYVILKELDLQMREDDKVAFHSLYRDEEGEIACRTTGRYLDIHPNAISEAFTELYDREIKRSFGGSLR